MNYGKIKINQRNPLFCEKYKSVTLVFLNMFYIYIVTLTLRYLFDFRADIDGWELRRGMNELYGYDLVPEPKIVVAALQACRRYVLSAVLLLLLLINSVYSKCFMNPIFIKHHI